MVVLRTSTQEAEGERGAQEISWIHFLIVLLRNPIEEERGGGQEKV